MMLSAGSFVNQASRHGGWGTGNMSQIRKNSGILQQGLFIHADHSRTLAT
jgi:hypothetical protein